MMSSAVKTISKWLELPHPILSHELKQLLEDLMITIHGHLLLDEVETEKDWREELNKLPIVSCTFSNKDAGIVKVSFLTFEFPSLKTDRFVYELFDRFVLSKCQCVELGTTVLKKSFFTGLKPSPIIT